MSLASLRQFFRDNPRMWIAVALAVIVAGITAAWIFSGFSLGFSQFFAAAPTKSVLQVTCSGTTATLTWNIPPDANSNSIEKNINGQGWTYILQTTPESGTSTTTDTFTPTTQYRHKSGASVASDIVQCPAATLVPTPTLVATPIPTPTPTAIPTQIATPVPTPTPTDVIPTPLPPVTPVSTAPPSVPVISASHPGTLCLDRGYLFSGAVTGGKPNTLVHLFVQSPDGSMLFDDVTDNSIATDQQGNGSGSEFIQLTSPRFQVGTYTGWVTIGGVTSNTISASVVSCGTPAPTPASQSGTVLCAPDVQSVAKGEPAYIQAIGGDGHYTWTTSGGGTQQDGGADFVTFSYLVAGTKTVTVRSSGGSAMCTVVVGNVATPPPAGQGSFAVTKRARNLSRGEDAFQSSVIAQSGEAVEFELQIQSTAAPGTPMTVQDTLPDGMSYRNGLTLVNGSAAADGIVTSTGLQVSVPASGAITTVQWIAVTDQTDGLSATGHQTRPRAVVVVGAQEAIADMAMTVVGTGTGAGGGTGTGGSTVGQIPTGPGDAVVLALMAAATVTLLYTGYTRSPAFRRKEVEQIQRDQGPLDFRS